MKNALILFGDGINCEGESEVAFRRAGAETALLHVNRFLEEPEILLDFQILCLPGGFSFGDELRSGKILAEKMRPSWNQVFPQFLKNGGLTLGICNGFQVLIQLGVFEQNSNDRTLTLATNDHGRFHDQWVEVLIDPSGAKSPWFQGISGSLFLPIRHKEGRIIFEAKSTSFTPWIPLKYREDVNGAYQQGAALLDPTGQILGLMPHPEAALEDFLNPLSERTDRTQNADKVRKIFTNAVSNPTRIT